MRIISVHPGAVALVFGIIYAVFGLVAFAVWAFSSLQSLVLPIGIIMGIFHLNLNIPVARSPDLLANALLCIAAVFCYGLTGCITGAAVAVCFNFVAQKIGGIDAKFVSLAGDDSAAKQQLV
jgi:hypothetical protein